MKDSANKFIADAYSAYRIVIIIFLFLILMLDKAFSATIWLEDFSTYTEGTGHAGRSDIGDYPASVSKWTLDYSNSSFRNDGDYVMVTNGLFEAQDNDPATIWYSESITITGYSNVNASVDLSSSGANGGDTLGVYYSLDGATPIMFTNGGIDGGTASITATASSLIGTNLQIIIRISSSGQGKLMRFDNVTVSGTVSDPSNLLTTPDANGTVIDLSWTQNAGSEDVMVAYSLDGIFGNPVDETAYVATNTIPSGGTVIYNGANTTYSHTGLLKNTTYYYKAWSVNTSDQYSAGILTNDTSLPVELGVWKASAEKGVVKLTWITESEFENQGFIIKRTSTSLRSPSYAGQAGSATGWEEIASFITHLELMGQGSTTRQTVYEFIDADVSVGETYDYQLSDVDYINTLTAHDIISVTVRADDETQIPGGITLLGAYPNPFNPSITLEFEIMQDSFISVLIYDLRGKEIVSLVQDQRSSGWHRVVWNALDAEGRIVPSGVYMARIQAGSFSQTVKMMYME